MNQTQLEELLALDDFTPIYKQADIVRREHVGDIVHIRAILEFSNYCNRACSYCGLNCTNRNLTRYRISPKEIVDTANQAYACGYQTIVLQSGEDPYYTDEILGQIVRQIHSTGMKITLSCGERSFESYQYLKACGADRYLIKHETADRAIYKRLHPNSRFDERLRCLRDVKSLGYETGSGFMIGLPGQTLATIAKDILLLKALQCDMAGIGPFIPHADTPLGNHPAGSTELTKRAIALSRILMPTLNLPATTSLGVINSGEKEDVFSCGANVVMRKVTPTSYKQFYEIYPAKLMPTDILADRKELEQMIYALGRIPK